MKIIHCADLHLDSRLSANLDRERAKQRRGELLQNFSRLAQYAQEEGVEAVLIAGDLFDRDAVSALARNTVLSVIEAHPQIRFFYLRGNHDGGDCLRTGAADRAPIGPDPFSVGGKAFSGPGAASAADRAPIGPNPFSVGGKAFSGPYPDAAADKSPIGRDRAPGPVGGPPGNLFLFGSRWKTYREGRIAITGIELTKGNAAAAAASLRLDPDCFNIVLLHGATGTGAGEIDLRALRGRGIDYLALGHIHAGGTARLDRRGICCYPGCLEGRGFDEPGPHGFMLLEIDEKIPEGDGKPTRPAPAEGSSFARGGKAGFSPGGRTASGGLLPQKADAGGGALRPQAVASAAVSGDGALRMSLRFVPFARRILHALRVDVAGCRTTAQMKDLVEDALRDAGCRREDMAEVTLCGGLDVECEKDAGYLEAVLSGRLFFARVKDATTPHIDLGDYLYDESLRGEFVRLVMESGAVPDEDRAAVIRWGFLAMDGEELL